MALPKSNAAPITALLLSLYAAVALSPATAYGPFPASDNTSIAEPPFSSSPSPSPAPTFGNNILFISAAPYPAAAAAAPSIAEPPFSSSSSAAPAPAPAFEEMLVATGAPSASPVDVQAMDSRYLTAVMSAAAHKVEQFLAEEVEARLQDSDSECLSICKEVYESAVESMRSGIESVDAGNFVKASFDVSSFNTDVDTCRECGGGGFAKLDQWAKGIAGDCLDRIVKYTNRV